MNMVVDYEIENQCWPPLFYLMTATVTKTVLLLFLDTIFIAVDSMSETRRLKI